MSPHKELQFVSSLQEKQPLLSHCNTQTFPVSNWLNIISADKLIPHWISQLQFTQLPQTSIQRGLLTRNETNVSYRNKQGPTGQIWGYTGLCRNIQAIQGHAEPYYAMLDLTGLSGIIRDHMGTYETIWDYRGPSRTIGDNTGPNCTIRDHTMQCHICYHTGPYWTIWDHTGP